MEVSESCREDGLDVVLKKLDPQIKSKKDEALGHFKPSPLSTAETDLMKILSQPVLPFSAPVKTELTNTKQGVKVFVKKSSQKAAEVASPPIVSPQKQPEDKDEERRESTPAMKNPLYWFGYFPPQPLVQAQKNYSTGVHYSKPAS